MSKTIITHKNYESNIQKIEENLLENIKLSKAILEDFLEKIDNGDLADLSLKYVLEKNLEIANNAFNEFVKLPISWHNI